MLKTKRFKFFVILFILLFVFTLTSCGACSGPQYSTRFDQDLSSSNTDANNKIEWVVKKVSEAGAVVKQEIADLEAQLQAEGITDAQKLELQKQIAEKEIYYVDVIKSQAKDIVLSVVLDENNEYIFVNDSTDYLIIQGIAGEEDTDKALKNYKVQMIQSDALLYASYIDKATVIDENIVEKYTEALEKEKTSCVSCFFAQTNKPARSKIENVENETNVYDIIAIFTLQVSERMKEAEPLKFYGGSFGEVMGNFFNNFFVFPVGWLLYIISKLCGGYYVIGLIITTLLIRTIGWPIYAKTNNMSLKMKAIEPEVAKIQAKYANRKDPDSQRMMQMEQARLYKQNGIGIGGCLMPFLQFPIFMAVYRAISRIPATIATPNTTYTLNWGGELNGHIFNLNLFEDYTAGTGQMIWIIILVVLVSATQLLSQILSELRQKKAKEKAQEDIPAYRRQAVKQQANDSQKTMKMVMYLMIFMMAVFVWTSKAALGLYWLIGNLYSLLQTYINTKQSEKKLAKIREQQKGY